FVDFATGIYVAPTKAAVLDKKTGTFKDNSIGKVNNKTGAYIPPKGIKLDAKKGFVVDTKKSAKIASTSDKKKLQKTLASLNQGVKKQIVVNKVESKPMKQLTSNWLPKNHILSAEFRPYSEILTVKNKNEGSSSDFYTSSASWILFTWQQDWSEKWSSRLKFGAHVYEIDDSISNSDNSSSKVSINEDGGSDGPAYLSVGAVYKYSKKWTFLGELVMREVYYVVPDGGSSSGDSNLRKDSSEVGSIDLGAEYFVGEWKNLILTAGGIIHIIGTEEVPSASGGCFGTNTNCDYREEADMFGFALSFDAHYQWKTNMGVTSSLWYDSIDADADSISYTRNSIGVGFDFIWDI
ncbi:hypothetical protein HOB30_01970, partial [Candidatus Falkowbacteria bacterium]|nr:hypothetical protein [Candidatus Falkowbacteria bacterium]